MSKSVFCVPIFVCISLRMQTALMSSADVTLMSDCGGLSQFMHRSVGWLDCAWRLKK
jgi:hypothetical protein